MTNQTKAIDDKENQASFEEKVAMIETIIDQLEKEEEGLAAMIDKYQTGTKLLTECHQLLDKAEKELLIIDKDSSDG